MESYVRSDFSISPAGFTVLIIFCNFILLKKPEMKIILQLGNLSIKNNAISCPQESFFSKDWGILISKTAKSIFENF